MKNDTKRALDPETKYHLAGWILFVICAFFFLAASWRSGDWLTFIGSVLFLIACILFMIPLLRNGPAEEDR